MTDNPRLTPEVVALARVVDSAGRLASPTAIAEAVLAAGYRPPEDDA